MSNEISYTTEEIAKLLRISKLTVYDLIKKGELPAYRVGRQMRVDAVDLEAYKSRSKGEYKPVATQSHTSLHPSVPPAPDMQSRVSSRSVIISGQDVSLDMLAAQLERQDQSFRPLRSYAGSINSLIAMYTGKADIVSTHLYDGESGEYNIPYIRRMLSGHRFVVINLLSRMAGFYVQPGNPKNIASWNDLLRPGIRMVNREKGSGARTLIEEQFRLHQIAGKDVEGYGREEPNHLAVAGVVARREADVGIGIEKAARLVGVEFIPCIRERYDLVILKTEDNESLIRQVLHILRSESFHKELASIGGYELTNTGQILYETW